MYWRLVPILFCLFACEAEDDLSTPQQGSDAGSSDPDGGESTDAAPPVDTGIVTGAGAYIVVADFTEGLGFGDWLGADIDAVAWDCSGTSGFAVAATGERDESQAAYAVGPALGAPDAPCDPFETCATPLGRYGYLAFQVERETLDGCEVTVYEMADRTDEMFNVYSCPTAVFDNTCGAAVFSGTDGVAATGTF